MLTQYKVVIQSTDILAAKALKPQLTARLSSNGYFFLLEINPL